MNEYPKWFLRLEEEHGQLIERIAKLRVFMGGNEYRTLDEPYRILLHTQHIAMSQYCAALEARIALGPDC